MFHSPTDSNIRGSAASSKRQIFYIISAVFILTLLILISLNLGHFASSLFAQNTQMDAFIIYEIRLPRTLGAALIGASLALCGSVYQSIFVNPLVSPGILGTSAGAGFGAALAMVLGLGGGAIMLFGFVFGVCAVLLALGIAWVYGRNTNILMLILGGIISSALFGAGLSVLKLNADTDNVLPNIVFWLMGSFVNISNESLMLPAAVMGACIFGIFCFGKELNAMSQGSDVAKSLGVSVGFVRFILIAMGTLLVALSVGLSGVIGWVGLVVPHACRFLVGCDNRFLMPFCCLAGGIFMLICDLLSRSIFSSEIPIGIITSFVGIAFFAFVLYKVKVKNYD